MLLRQLKLFFRQLPAGRRALALVWEAARGWTVAWAILLVAQGLIPAGQALLPQSLVQPAGGRAGVGIDRASGPGNRKPLDTGTTLVQLSFLGQGGTGRAGAGRGPPAHPHSGSAPGLGLL